MNLFRNRSGYADLMEQSLERQHREREVKRWATLKTVPQRRKPPTIATRLRAWIAAHGTQLLCAAIVICGLLVAAAQA